jgi:hypothetical protein
MKNFKIFQNKPGYTYPLTPHSLEEKASITLAFYKRNKNEYKELKKEVERLGLVCGC